MNAPKQTPASIGVTLQQLRALVGDDYDLGSGSTPEKRLSVALSALSQAGRELCVFAYLPREGELDSEDIQFVLWRLGERLKGIAEILAAREIAEGSGS
jgi:hypothetical protein